MTMTLNFLQTSLTLLVEAGKKGITLCSHDCHMLRRNLSQLISAQIVIM